MRELPDLGPRRLGVVTSAEARAAGWSDDALARAAASGRLARIAPGRFAPVPPSDVPAPALADLSLARRAVAASLPGREVFVSHLAAAVVRGLPTWASRPTACVSVVGGRSGPLQGVHVHRVGACDGDFGVSGGVRLTSVPRTVLDVAGEHGGEAGLVVVDAAVRAGLASRAELTAALGAAGRRPGTRAARVAVELLDPAAESPLESRSRWHLHLHDVDPPRTQVELFAAGGRFLGRSDFYWPDGVVGEVDGTGKYTDPAVLRREKWREQGMEDHGLQVVRWGAASFSSFGAVVARIARARDRARAVPGERDWYAVPAPG